MVISTASHCNMFLVPIQFCKCTKILRSLQFVKEHKIQAVLGGTQSQVKLKKKKAVTAKE